MRGPWITGSYYRNRDESKFDDGWLRTGDVGRIDPLGYVTLTDRAKDVIKSGGEWISSVELENHLMGHPAVIEAAVVARARRALAGAAAGGRGRQRGCRGVARRSCGSSWRDKVVRWWLPERWAFVDQVPLTSVGKFDKKTIRARYAENAYDVVEQRDYLRVQLRTGREVRVAAALAPQSANES